MLIGRREIFTDVVEITKENIIQILQKAMPEFTDIASKCDFLLRYEAGEQPIVREKKYRSDIDCRCEDNIANEITEFKLGFNWGNPITLVQRGEKDSGSKEEAEAIALLNECYEAEKNKAKSQQLARFIEICGIGYTFVDINTKWQEGDSYFSLNVLDPRNAFIIKSSHYVDHRPMVGVSFRKDEKGDTYFTCFTATERFEILNLAKIIGEKTVVKDEKAQRGKDGCRWDHRDRSGESNPLGMIPIIEWIRSYDRMGCFERQISEMDNLNLLISDFTNDVEQNTQAIWHTNDVDFPKEQSENGEATEKTRTPRTSEWVQTFTSHDGKTPFIKPLAVDYDYAGMLNNIVTRRSLILQKCNVPQRNDNSGGSTGVAMSDATGWSAAEAAACKEQNIIEGCKMEEVKAVLAAIKKSPDVPSDSLLLKLKHSDVQPNIKRQKTYEMTVKANAFATWVSHGINGLHALKNINAFDDPNQVWEDSKDMIMAYQKSVFEKAKTENTPVGGDGEPKPNRGRLSADESDQIVNSPRIDSNRTE